MADASQTGGPGSQAAGSVNASGADLEAGGGTQGVPL